MKTLAYLLAPALLCLLCVPSADAGTKKKKSLSPVGEVTATVVSLTKGEGTDGLGALTVKVPGAKKKAPATERKFELSKGVKLETLTVAKKVFSIQAAAVEDFKQGDLVLIQLKESNADQPDRVIRVAAAKKKKTD
jgi:hypothetical protein